MISSSFSMDSKPTKFHALSASIARRVFLRALLLASAVSIVSLLRFLPSIDFQSLTPKTYVDCVNDSFSNSQNDAALTPGSYLFQSRILNTFWGSFDSMNCKIIFNFTSKIVKTLIGQRLLNYASKTLCVGENSLFSVSAMKNLGFSTVTGVHKNPFFSLNKRKITCHLEFNDSSFDFVLSKDFDKVSVPALLVLEIERILKPGGIGAFYAVNDFNVSSLLRSSTVVHVGYDVNELSLIVFKKRSENENGLPGVCENVAMKKPLVELMEPLVEERQVFEYEKSVSYLPKFVDVSRKKRLVYVDIGVGESLNENVSNWFPPYYPIDQKDFNVYFVHYNTSVLLSYVKQPGVTFVYHPGLAENVAVAANNGDVDPFLGEEEFDLLVWFKETVEYVDFVVLKMNAGVVEMKFLNDIVESGDICFVDELFLGCSESGVGKSESMNKRRERCMDIYKGLRRNGVYVHQLWDTKLLQGSQVSYV